MYQPTPAVACAQLMSLAACELCGRAWLPDTQPWRSSSPGGLCNACRWLHRAPTRSFWSLSRGDAGRMYSRCVTSHHGAVSAFLDASTPSGVAMAGVDFAPPSSAAPSRVQQGVSSGPKARSACDDEYVNNTVGPSERVDQRASCIASRAGGRSQGRDGLVEPVQQKKSGAVGARPSDCGASWVGMAGAAALPLSAPSAPNFPCCHHLQRLGVRYLAWNVNPACARLTAHATLRYYHTQVAAFMRTRAWHGIYRARVAVDSCGIRTQHTLLGSTEQARASNRDRVSTQSSCQITSNPQGLIVRQKLRSRRHSLVVWSYARSLAVFGSRSAAVKSAWPSDPLEPRS